MRCFAESAERRVWLDIEAEDLGGFTPLHYAVDYSSAEMAEAFLNVGVNIKARSNDRQRPCDLAERNDALKGTPTIARLQPRRWFSFAE